MARPVSDRTPAPLLLGGPAGAPPGGGALLGLRSLLQGTSKPKEPASFRGPPIGKGLGPRVLHSRGEKAEELHSRSPMEARAELPIFLEKGGRDCRIVCAPVARGLGRRGEGRGGRFSRVPQRAGGTGSLEVEKTRRSERKGVLPLAAWGLLGRAAGRSGNPGHTCHGSNLPAEPGPAPCQPHTPAPRLTSRDTPSPVDPDTVEVLMTFEPDPADLALSSIPGHETFDPRRHRFSEEELKPQPIMKKARKIQVPEEQKDEKYWSRRYKNNEAAKRSRDARRLKENQISVRAAFLEKENALLRQEVVAVRQELSHYRAVLSRYQAQHGAL
ncbi:LOW QUALITY PROTEIN: D site-binding protein [Myotis lucifugus]|uniref:LOW QUALITY PROTEIN: D site-binding protein n=1 Tax=Myotis lucifugus TaxID=59463 RepID=UPI0006D707A3|nr:LOW QUALITY PROTEIN: D site-binding protein [Myotis lucifugus]